MNRLTSKQPLTLGNEQQETFDHLIEALTPTPVLALPDSSDMFILYTDVSDLAISAKLVHLQDGKKRIIAYGIYSLTPEQQRYCTTRRKLLAILRLRNSLITIYRAETS